MKIALCYCRWANFFARVLVRRKVLLILLLSLFTVPANAAVVPTMSQRAAEQFAKIEKSIAAAESSGSYKKTLALLNKVAGRRKSFNGYEQALLDRYFGFVYYSTKDYHLATKAYERALQHADQLPKAVHSDTLYTLGQLYFSLADYHKAISWFEPWLTMVGEQNINAASAVLLAHSYYQTNRLTDARRFINRAIEQGGAQKIKESWYLLAYTIAYEQKRYREAATILKRLVNNHPKADYWRQLASLYGVLSQPRQQLAALEALYKLQAFGKPQEYLNLVSLYLQLNYPYRAAIILKQALAQGDVGRSAKHYELLASAWQQAEETDLAIAALKQAAEKGGTRKSAIYGYLAALYFSKEKDELALVASQRALEGTNFNGAGRTRLLQGIIYARRYDCQAAKASFAPIADQNAYRQEVQRWLVFCAAQ